MAVEDVILFNQMRSREDSIVLLDNWRKSFLEPGTGAGTRGLKLMALAGGLLALCGCATSPIEHNMAEDAIDKGDTAWLIVSVVLVMLMTPALALFYGGLVRQKNILSIFMQCFMAMGVISLQWVLIGYSLAFAPSAVTVGEGGYGLIGGLHFAGTNFGANVLLQPSTVYAPTVPHRFFMVFQCMFAIITPAIIAGAFAERMKFKTFLVFIVLWSTLVYDPICHWVWNPDGWLLKRGSLDFAGGTVVHMTSGVTALLLAIMIKPRRGFPREAFIPHNLVFTVLGAGLLWFGWFGFNGGSAVSVGALAVNALTTTHFAAAAGAVAWAVYDWVTKDKPTVLGAASGAIAGLVAITPASGFVGITSSIAIGIIAAVACAWFVTWRARRGIDDALDAFGIHGVGGTLGALLTGVFATQLVNPAIPDGFNGLIRGEGSLIIAQIEAVGVTFVYTLVVSYIILKVLDMTMGLRVSVEEEQMGLDLTQHGEAAYSS